MARLALVAGALLFTACLPARAAAECADADAMAADDRAWLETSLEQWRRSLRDELRVADQSLPDIYAVDANCTYRLPGGSFETLSAEAHPEGSATLPSVGTVPLGPISFAFAADGFAMSLPSVWRAAGVTSNFGLERLMTGVLLHEILHTRQAQMIGEVAEPAARAGGVSDDDLSDDLLQERFADRPGYRAAYEAERDALFAAATAPDLAGARGLAAHALHLMRERRARFLSGENAHFAVFDDVFLTMEGSSQWLIYRYFLSPEGGAADAAAALAETRRGGRWWSQDEGLALVLVLDRLLPDWRARIFREPDWRAEALLAAAIAS